MVCGLEKVSGTVSHHILFAFVTVVSSDFSIKLWDINKGVCKHTYKGNLLTARLFEISHDDTNSL